jgi:RNA polymerase sigma-70 factor (ECF subfamily)
LIASARRGNQDAIRQIYENYFSPIYGFIRMRVSDTNVAEDLASDVFIRMIEAFRGNNPPKDSLRGWLFRVARNVIHDHYGQTKRIEQITLEEWIPASEDSNVEIQFMRSLNIAQARQALQRLTDEQQEVILLRFGHALSLQETADIMGKKPNAVKALQFRAVNALRRILGELRTETSYG